MPEDLRLFCIVIVFLKPTSIFFVCKFIDKKISVPTKGYKLWVKGFKENAGQKSGDGQPKELMKTAHEVATYQNT